MNHPETALLYNSIEKPAVCTAGFLGGVTIGLLYSCEDESQVLIYRFRSFIIDISE